MNPELDQRFRDTVLQELSDLSKESRNMTLMVESLKTDVNSSNNEIVTGKQTGLPHHQQ